MTTTPSPVGGGRTDATIDGKWRRGRRRSFFVPDRRFGASANIRVPFLFNVAIFSWTNCAIFAPPPAGAEGGEENKRGELPFLFVSRFERKPWLTNCQSRA